jgi:hypothetical protein
VVTQAFGGISKAEIDCILSLQAAVERMRRLPQLGLATRGHASDQFPQRLENYLLAVRRLYAGIATVSAKRVVVDSSKDPAYALILARLPMVDLCVVHLTRDSRGVAYSHLRGKMNYRRASSPQPMVQYSLLQTAFGWSFYNLCYAAFSRFGRGRVRHFRLRYEDLIAEPAAQIIRLGQTLGLDPKPNLGFIRDGEAMLGINHAVDGNPSRFSTGLIKLGLDDQWRQTMKHWQRRVITLLTWPLLRRYDYLH